MPVLPRFVRRPLLVSAIGFALATQAGNALAAAVPTHHVLLISIDGLHERDLERFIDSRPDSALAALAGRSVRYRQAMTVAPSDSFPGLAALLTGGTPRSTGLYYDDTYSRTLAGADCKPGSEVVLDESVDIDPDAIDGGGGIRVTALPRDPARGCAPVFPHAYLRVNTVFEVVKAAGGRTAWADKHLAYDWVNGPSGRGVDDLYTPEIAAGNADGSVEKAEVNDDLKVTAILEHIAGHDHAGRAAPGVPALFGMNFQAVSVGQKTAGYRDAQATPSDGLAQALQHTDASLHRILLALSHAHLDADTLLVVTAKHGQSPIDPALRRIVDGKLIPSIVNGVQAGLLAHATQDDVALLWLRDGSKTAEVVTALNARRSEAHIGDILSGRRLAALFNDPMQDDRVPDIVVLPEPGVIYTKPAASKRAEHGGFSEDDRHVALLVAMPGMAAGKTVDTPVSATQVAPTMLKALGLSPADLQSVRREGTPVLPGLGW
ncbi:alkaline phosphatase family protein [Paludibacterium yongneupense]|uniref:alkaline phosphatase family protein n=1 Tax=Paludibacterium yongneupense TaxID=400061 RepID=UPI0004070B1E|nr:alkaline phosphatase family protein [Paludibacterium yongneupense]